MNSKQIISGVLSLAMTSSICTYSIPSAYATDTQDTKIVKANNAVGEIAFTINFALPQTKAEVESRNIKLTLTKGSSSSTITLSNNNITGSLLSSDKVSISPLEISDKQFGSYNIVLSGLETGEYSLELTGDGYTNISEKVDLNQYSKHLIVSTDDGTFSLGDFNNDGIVDVYDQKMLQEVLGSKYNETIAKFDLDGDKDIDITDLSYVNRNKNLTGNVIVKETSLIADVSVETNDIIVEEGNITDIFTTNNQSVVKISSTSESSDIQIPVTLSDSGVELSEIKITTPATDGAIKEGVAVVELANGETQEINFSQLSTEARMARAAIDNVITINLGQKVAVKKVTIKVTKVEGDVGYAAVSQVQFLKDVNINTEDTSKVKNLAASAGDKQVNLAWSAVNNVTGYTVYYGTSKDNINNTLSVSTNSATVDGLKNNTTYYFKVVATSEGWTGTESSVISATPIPAEVPGKPSNIQIKPADSSLRISWSDTKDATKYQVYYREQGSSEFIKFGNDISFTNATITGLTNDVTYEIVIKAGNQVGFGEYSDIATGKPEKEGFEMPNLPTEDRINSITSVKMGNANNVDKNLCPNFNVNQVIDNDVNTYWVAGDWWLDSSFTYTFDTPQDMNYAILVPYLSDKHKKVIKTYSVVARDAEGNIVSEVTNRSARLTSDNYIILTFPQAKNIKTLTISLAEVEGGGARVSISEMAFYKSSTLADDIANLFADNAFTSLKPDVQLSDIEALEEKLNATSSYYMDIERLRDEINLAKALYNSDNSALGLIKNDFVSRSAGNDNSKFGQSASALQPIGITAKANSNIAIYAEIPEGESVYIVPTQYYGESGVWKGNAIKLENGRNYITIPQIGNLSATRGGALYLTYSGNNADDIKIHVRGNNNEVFNTPILDLSNWYNMSVEDRKTTISTYITELQNYVDNMNVNDLPLSIRNATEIATPSILLSMPADQILNGLVNAGTSKNNIYNNLTSILNTASVESMTEAMYQNVLAWEEEMYVANMVQGIIPADTEFKNYQYPMETRQNIRYMRMFAGAFMYAAGEHIGVEYGSCAPLVQGKPTSMTSGQAENGLFGWGIAHEIGHNMDKIGYAEITNNIYSMAMQAWDGSDMTTHMTRLTTDGRWIKIFEKTAQSREGMANDVFVQLGMYWQLHLAYDNAENPLAFYNKFFTELKGNKYSGYTKDERIALIASEITGYDLSEFFTRWGMKLGESALSIIQSYQDENRAIWYLNDKSRNARLDNVSANSGTTSVSTSVNENTVTLTISNTDEATIQGYEIIRNGVTIGFTTTNTYKDNLGAANNLAYTYKVVPVDILGNVGKSVTSDEIRISYDKTIDASLYDMIKNEDGTIIVTMKDGASIPVTGLKIIGANGSNVTVKVKSVYGISNDTEITSLTQNNEQFNNWIIAKDNVSITSDNCNIYFNKPNTDSSDTRIWTYDVAVMEISGVPENATVKLLDYPGDKVDFYEGSTAGVLKNDYKYGDNADDIIKAGTLVIIGTYRGDPAYNYVEVMATYNTTSEAQEANEVTTITRPMNGYTLMFAEIPEDGAVSDTSDGFFIFVPDLEAEKELNKTDGVTDNLPLEIKLNMYRTDSADNTDSKRLTSETLWLSFPDENSLPQIEFTNNSGVK